MSESSAGVDLETTDEIEIVASPGMETGWKPLLLVLAVLVTAMAGFGAWLYSKVPSEQEAMLNRVEITTCIVDLGRNRVTATVEYRAGYAYTRGPEHVEIQIGFVDQRGTALGSSRVDIKSSLLSPQFRAVSAPLRPESTAANCVVENVTRAPDS